MRPASLPAPLLALLLLPLLPGGVAQGDTPLQVTVEETAWTYGPETWKGPDPAAPGADGRFGSRLDAEVALRRDGSDAPITWTLDATLTDGTTTVTGTVLEQAAGRATLRFDVDGHGATAARTAAPPLEPGAWTLRVDADGPDGPQGFGVARIQSHALTFHADRPGATVPEDLLPGLDEVGAGDTTWMPLAPAQGAVRFTVATDHAGPVTWTAWTRNGTAAPLGLPAGLPAALGPWTATPLGTTPPRDGAARFTVDADRLGDGLHVLSAQQPGAPATSWLLPVGATATVTDVAAPEPGRTGPVTYTIRRDDDQTAGLATGTAHALLQDPLAATTHGSGAPLAQAPLLPTGPGEARAALDTAALRASGQTHYLFLALLLDADGAYAGHGTHLRGAVAALKVPALHAGASAPVGVRLQHAASLGGADSLDPGLALPALVDLLVEGESLGATTVHVPHGGTLTRALPHRPTSPGVVLVEARVDTGDLAFTLRESHVVEPADRDAPLGGAVAPLALLAAALAARRRDPPLRKHHIRA